MILDKNGKLFGKINIIDVFAVIILIAAIIGISIRFISVPSKNVKNKIELTYVVEIEGVSDFTVDALNKQGKVIDSKQKCLVGEVIGVESRKQTLDKFDSDGNLLSSEVPEKYTVDVTIEAIGKESEHGYFVGNDTELSVGSTVKLATKYVNTSGKVKQIIKK